MLQSQVGYFWINLAHWCNKNVNNMFNEQQSTDKNTNWNKRKSSIIYAVTIGVSEQQSSDMTQRTYFSDIFDDLELAWITGDESH